MELSAPVLWRDSLDGGDFYCSPQNRATCDLGQDARLSEKFEKAGTVDFKNTPHGRWGQSPGRVDPRFPAGLPFLVPEIPEFVAFHNSGKCSSYFPGTFPEFSSGTSEQTPETATTFSSFLRLPCDPESLANDDFLSDSNGQTDCRNALPYLSLRSKLLAMAIRNFGALK